MTDTLPSTRHPAGTAVLLAGHGSRREAANRELATLAERCAERLGLPVRHAFLELAEPSIETVLSELAERHVHVLVEPVFLFAAGHIKRDVPACVDAVARRVPRTRIEMSGALGVHPNMAALAALRAAETWHAWQPGTRPVLLLVGRGASDEAALAELDGVMRRLRRVHGYRHVEVAYADVSEPRFEAVLERLARTAEAPVLVLPYLLFGGVLVDRLREGIEQTNATYPRFQARLAAPLGAHPLLVEWVAARVRVRLCGPKTGRAPPLQA